MRRVGGAGADACAGGLVDEGVGVGVVVAGVAVAEEVIVVWLAPFTSRRESDGLVGIC